MISDELVEVPHLPDIEVHAQLEVELNIPRRASRVQRAASVSAFDLKKGLTQNGLQRSTSADHNSKNYTESAIYRIDNLKIGRNSSGRKMSLISTNGREGSAELANKNGHYRRLSEEANKDGQNKHGQMQMTTTLGHLLNTIDNRLVSRDLEPESMLALRDCRYIRIYSPALKRSTGYRRASSWDMPGTPSGGLMSGR